MIIINKKQYIPKLFDDVLSFVLKSKGAVLVVGPKWCGKSATCKKHAKTIHLRNVPFFNYYKSFLFYIFDNISITTIFINLKVVEKSVEFYKKIQNILTLFC